MKISLAQLTLTDASPEELVDIAAELGCHHVCLFPAVPIQSPMSVPTVTGAPAARDLRRLIDGRGLSVANVEAVFCSPAVSPQAFEKTMEIGAILGAQRISCLNMHPNFSAAVEQLGEFCTLAAGYGLVVAVEWTRRSETRSLPEALRLVQAVGVPSLGLVVDVLHLMRNGGVPADLASVPPGTIHYAQMSDGPLQMPGNQQAHEARFDRQFPGEGEFPLMEFVKILPPDIVVAIEAPAQRLASLPPLERARRAVDGTRRVLAAAGLGHGTCLG